MDKVSIYNPFVGAYCELPIDDVKKFIKSAKEAEKKIKKEEKANE